MHQTILPVNEQERIAALRKYNILDTPPDGAFDRITQLASIIFKVPISIISLVDTDRIWFKSHYGLPVNQIDREPGLCASAILADDLYVIKNAAEDPRSLSNPLVAGEFGLRFYAAMPLQTEQLYNLGTLCIIDKQPREFGDEEKYILKELARIVMDEMDLRLAVRNTVTKMKKLTFDMSVYVTQTISEINKDGDCDRDKLASYLEATKIFLLNTENQLDQV